MKKFLVSLVWLIAGGAAADVEWDPLFSDVSHSNGASFLAVRPFYSHTDDPAGERWRSDFLWPLYTRKGFKDETYGRFLFFGFSLDFSEADARERFWVLPFWFHGEDQAGERYAALFPLGGTIHEFLGRDRVVFALFPLYLHTQVNEVETTAVLWPIWSRTQGDKVERFRVWPLYGRSILNGEFEKRFVLWPLYNSVKYTHARNPGGGFIAFPFYGRVTTEQATNTWVLPPLFRRAVSEDQRILHAPWPFVQLADGGLYKRYFWPIYGRKRVSNLDKQFLLWPVFWKMTAEQPESVRHRLFVFPLYSQVKDVAKDGAGSVLEHYWKVWPLMSWERSGAESRLRLLELWPMRNTAGVERNWAPFWSLYRRTASAGEVRHRLFWDLYEQRSRADGFEWSLLKGLVGYRTAGDDSQLRLLFKWFGAGEEQ